MTTVTITTKEYQALVFAKKTAKILPVKKSFLDAAFGVFKKAFGKKSSTQVVHSLRKSWRA